MSEELKVTKEAVERAAEKCPQAKTVLTEMFPNVFPPKEEWEDVTDKCFLMTSIGMGRGKPSLYIAHNLLARFTIEAVGVPFEVSESENYKISEGRIWRRK